MIRKSLTILSLIGLLLSAGLWGASYWRVGFVWPPKISLELRHGSVQLLYIWDIYLWDLEDVPAIEKSKGHEVWTLAGAAVWCRGFANWRTSYWRFEYEDYGDSLLIEFPLWLPCPLCAAMPLCYLVPFHRRRKRKKLGLCLQCGYDLRGSTDRCPECGNEFGTT